MDVQPNLRILVAISLASLLGCPREQIHIDVGDGLEPTFTFEGGAAIVAQVKDTSACPFDERTEPPSLDVWVAAGGDNVLVSPIAYGETPEGFPNGSNPIFENVPPVGLVAGTTYCVRITRASGPSTGDGFGVEAEGFASFTP